VVVGCEASGLQGGENHHISIRVAEESGCYVYRDDPDTPGLIAALSFRKIVALSLYTDVMTSGACLLSMAMLLSNLTFHQKGVIMVRGQCQLPFSYG